MLAILPVKHKLQNKIICYKNQNHYLFTHAILIKRTLLIFRAKELSAATIQILGTQSNTVNVTWRHQVHDEKIVRYK